MKRCSPLPAIHSTAWRVPLMTALLACSLMASAQESVRPFPKNAMRGTLQVTQPPEVLLDGRAARLSPGARIRGVNNLLVLSGSLIGQDLVVNYVRDPQGLLHEVWLLNATEARQPMANAVAPNNYLSTYDTPTDGLAQPAK